MHKVIVEFLNRYRRTEKPLLLGYSGGPDSKALLYVLLDLKVPFAVAHVDHGWREESSKEACLIEEEVNSLKLPFFKETLSSQYPKTEEGARNGRLDFFSALLKKHSFEALVLAHHGDDLAETALKRVLEGASLHKLGGMRPVSQFSDFQIWRPLLRLEKKDLMSYLEEKELLFFSDATNEDPKFLRSRLRHTIFPFLEKGFGKNVKKNLCKLSELALELNDHLEEKLSSHSIVRGDFGSAVHLRDLSRLEGRYLLQKLSKKEGVQIARGEIEKLVLWAKTSLHEKKLNLSSKWAFVKKGWVIISPINKIQNSFNNYISN